MRKFFLLILSIVVLFANVQAQLRFAPELGIGLNSMRFTAGQFENIVPTMKTGGKIGCMLDIDMSDHMYAQAGLYFALKGAKSATTITYANDTMSKTNETLSTTYLQLPIDVLFKTGKAGGHRFFVGLGIYFAYAISAKDKYSYNTWGSGVLFDQASGTEKLQIGSNGAYNGFDIGINAKIGYELASGLIFSGYLDYGFNNASNNDFVTEKTWGFGVSAGYFIPRKKDKKSEGE
ncbi:MAG TPA: porin family protein [Flavipsychrobacter sp.]|nr:porin family protein [Flavipsychrobacter sp.]